MIACGIDAGSRALKIVMIDRVSLRVVARAVVDQGIQQDQLARELYDRMLAEHGIAPRDVTARVATGYGRHIVGFADRAVTEITCHAVGVHHVCPDARTIVDIGGQDSKVIRLNGGGMVEDFAMNDRCAAGTGRFLEVLAQRLEVGLNALGDLAARSTQPANISSMCVVFAETEIIGLLAGGATPEDIVAGVQSSIVQRVAIMAGRRVAAPVAFTGGVARVPGVDGALARAIDQPVAVVPDPQTTGALGAAIVAARGCGASAGSGLP